MPIGDLLDRLAVKGQDHPRFIDATSSATANADTTITLTAAQRLKAPDGTEVAPTMVWVIHKPASAVAPVACSFRSSTTTTIVFGAAGISIPVRVYYG